MKDHAPSAERNRHDILPALRDVLPQRGSVLEIASGTGQHAAHFAGHFPEVRWLPSERRTEMLPSIDAWVAEAGLPNVARAVELDVTWDVWPVEQADAIVNINMLHISPWSTCEALLAGAARVLAAGAPLYYYGAFFRDDCETAPSNLAFDQSLRSRDGAWGVRRLEDVVAAAQEQGLEFDRLVDMPNHNCSLVLRRR